MVRIRRTLFAIRACFRREGTRPSPTAVTAVYAFSCKAKKGLSQKSINERRGGYQPPAR